MSRHLSSGQLPADSSEDTIAGTPTSDKQDYSDGGPDMDPIQAELNQRNMEEDLSKKIERIGRERPEVFKSAGHEICFVFSIIMSQLVTEFFVAGFPVILPTLIEELDIPITYNVWPNTAFSLAIASTLLIFGRLGDMYGGYPVFIFGLHWMLLWTVISGFGVSQIMLNLCRAAQGLGAAAILPNGVKLMGSLYRPGPRKNLVFSLYGASAAFGFFFGITVAGVVGQFLRWGFYFWFGCVFIVITLLTSYLSIPNDKKYPGHVKMDWLGALTIVPGLVLTVTAITESAHTEERWRTPYVPILFSLGCLFLILALIFEGWVAKAPLLPPDVFSLPSMTPLSLGLLALYGTWGIFSVYGTLYFQHIMGATPTQVVAWYVPLGLTAMTLSVIEGTCLHLVPSHYLLIIAGLAAVGSQLLLALIPIGGDYWAFVFPATILSTIGTDTTTIIMTIFITTRLPSARQGLAGSLINSLLQLGVAVSLSVAELVQAYTYEEVGLRRSYKNTFWFGVALAATGFTLNAIWGRVSQPKSEITVDEMRDNIARG